MTPFQQELVATGTRLFIALIISAEILDWMLDWAVEPFVLMFGIVTLAWLLRFVGYAVGRGFAQHAMAETEARAAEYSKTAEAHAALSQVMRERMDD